MASHAASAVKSPQHERGSKPKAGRRKGGAVMVPPRYGIDVVDGQMPRQGAFGSMSAATAGPTAGHAAGAPGAPGPGEEPAEGEFSKAASELGQGARLLGRGLARGASAVGASVEAASEAITEKPAYDRIIDVLVKRFGMKPVDDKQLTGVTLQFQHMMNWWPPPGYTPPPGTRFTFRFQGQFAGKVEFNSKTEAEKLTLRADAGGLRQQEIEFPWNLRAAHTANDVFDIAEIHPKASLDSIAPVLNEQKQTWSAPKMAAQIGLEVTGKSAVLSDLNWGDPLPMKFKGALRFDLTELFSGKIATSKDFLSKVLSLQLEALPLIVSLDHIPPFSGLKAIVGGKWSCQFKVFLNIAGTHQFWADMFKLAQRAGSGIARGAAAVGRGVSAVAAVPGVLPVAIGAAGVAITVAGLLAIRRALESGRDDAILNAYYAGYAEALDGAVTKDDVWLATEIERFEDYDFMRGVEEVSAYVHGTPPPAVPYRIKPSGSRATDYGNALAYAAVDLGRATVMQSIYSLLKVGGARPWLEIRDGQRKHFEARRARGDRVSAKRAYLDALMRNEGGSIYTVGLPLHYLNDMFKPPDAK